MSRPITYSPLPDPGGLTPEEWAREVRLMKSKGWLRDPDSGDWPQDPDHPDNVARRQKEGACLRAGRAPAAVRCGQGSSRRG